MSEFVPAVGYARRSTDKQEASLPDQVKAVQRYAEDHGYQLLRWYTDDGISGDDTKKRLSFLRMLADAQEPGDFKAILCWQQDRFGRFSPLEASYRIYPLAQAGVQLVTTDKGPIDWNDFTEWLTYSVNQHGKHEFLKDHSRNVARGQLEAANNGSWVGSRPYAYRIEGPKKNKRLVLDDPAKAKIVQRIFREFVVEGRSMMDIAERLNKEGIVSPTGKVRGWRFGSVRVILENPAYTGDFAGGRYSYGKYHTRLRGTVAKANGKRLKRSAAEWVVKRDRHEAIIDRATFEKAKDILAKGKTGRGPYKPDDNPYVFSCLLRCGRCGAVLNGLTNGTYRYYECGNFKYNGRDACEGTTVREDKILHSIADHLYQEFLSLDGDDLALKAEREELTPADLPKAFAKVKRLVAPPKQPAADRRRMEKQAKSLADQIDKARRNLVLLDAENIPTAQDQIRKMQTERTELEVELRKKPPTEADVNAEALEVLRNLHWLGVLFRAAAEGAGGYPEYFEGARIEVPDPTRLRPFLRSVAGIKVHTRIEGHGRRTRHVLEGGEIAFGPVGLTGISQNPDLTD